MPLFTVGHSNHSIEAFIKLLNQHGVTAIADVRSSPYSRRFPHFSQSALKSALKSADVAYVFLGQELGARPKDQTCYVDGQARYELIAATEAFAQGLDRVVRGSERHQIALMCAEQDPVTCHRAVLVCQHLRKSGLEIQHILKNGDLEPHEHLEERLLKLHGLDELLPASNTLNNVSEEVEQLQLFDLGSSNSHHLEENSFKSGLREELIQKAYKLQGDRIAYVEEDHREQPHERAS